MRSRNCLVFACACAVWSITVLNSPAQEATPPSSNGEGVSLPAEAFVKARQQRAAEIDKLIGQLGADQFAKREEASEKLTELGAIARAALERALENKDPEIVLRARAILATIPPVTHTVVDALGAPISGAFVTIRLVTKENKEITSLRTLQAESDDLGRIPLLALPSSAHSLIVEISQGEYGCGRYEVGSHPHDGKELRFPLVRSSSDAGGRAVKGTVLDDAGRPVVGAVVRCQNIRTPGMGLIVPNEPLGEATTDAAGRFTYYLPNQDRRGERGELIPVNSNYQLSVAVEGNESYFPASGTYSNLAPHVITLLRAKKFHRFQFESADGGWISDPKQLAYLSVWLEGDPAAKQAGVPLERSVVTEGRALVNGKYSAQGFFNGSMVKYGTIEVTDDSPEALQFRLPATKVFRGRVLHGVTGQPLAGAYVMSYASSGQNNLARLTSEDWQKLPEIAAQPTVDFRSSGPLRDLYGVMALVRCDEHGQFEITQSRDKKFYGLIALAEDFVPFNVRILSLKTDVPGAVEAGDFPLFPAGKIVVRPIHRGERLSVSPKWLLEEAGQPEWIDRFRKATAGQNREFEYVHWLKIDEAQPLYVPAGIRLRVKFESPYDEAWAPAEPKEIIQLRPGETHDMGEIRFAASLPAMVRVLDERGKPLEGIPVRRRYDDGTGSVAHNTDAAGQVKFFVYPSSRGRFYIHDFPPPREQSKAANVFVKFEVAESAPSEPFVITLTDEQKRLLLEKPQRDIEPRP